MFDTGTKWQIHLSYPRGRYDTFCEPRISHIGKSAKIIQSFWLNELPVCHVDNTLPWAARLDDTRNA